jgi:heat shock protein HslJ
MRQFASLAFMIAGLCVFACKAERAPVPEELVGSEFLLEDLGGRGVMDNLQSTLKFESAEQVVGNGGCNRYFGSVEVKGDSIKFGPLGATQRMCPETVMDQEMRFLAALGKAYRIAMDGPYLYIHSQADDTTLKFTKLVKDPGERRKK